MLERLDQSALLRQRNDRIDELEEQVRQLKAAFAPQVGFPLSWRLEDREGEILSALFHTTGAYVSAEALRLLIVGFDDDAGESTVEVWVGRLRRKVGKQGIEIQTRPSQGYSLAGVSRTKVAEALGQTVTTPSRKGTHPRGWTEAEDAIVRAGYERRAQISVIRFELIGAGFRARSVGSISVRAQMLGLTHDRASSSWSADEDRILRDGYEEQSGVVEIRKALARAGFSRTRAGIQVRARTLEICGRSPARWTDEQIELLRRRCVENVPHRRIAAELGRPVSSIQDKVSDLGLLRRRPWTNEERQRLISGHAAGESGAVIATALKRSAGQVFAMASRLGLSFGGGRSA